MAWLFILAAGLVLAAWLWSTRYSKRTKNGIEGLEGEIIWRDLGTQTKPLFNRRYKVLGKLDLILFNSPSKTLVGVEYKSRQKHFYESDIVQSKTAALAARGAGINIQEILLINDTERKSIRLPVNDEDLYREIETHVTNVRIAKAKGCLPPTSSKHKCRSCGQRANCESFKKARQ